MDFASAQRQAEQVFEATIAAFISFSSELFWMIQREYSVGRRFKHQTCVDFFITSLPVSSAHSPTAQTFADFRQLRPIPGIRHLWYRPPDSPSVYKSRHTFATYPCIPQPHPRFSAHAARCLGRPAAARLRRALLFHLLTCVDRGGRESGLRLCGGP